jgi:hypothetical protein
MLDWIPCCNTCKTKTFFIAIVNSMYCDNLFYKNEDRFFDKIQCDIVGTYVKSSKSCETGLLIRWEI